MTYARKNQRPLYVYVAPVSVRLFWRPSAFLFKRPFSPGACVCAATCAPCPLSVAHLGALAFALP